MLLRTITALVGLAILWGGLWGGLPWVFLITLVAAVLGIREFYRLHPPDTPPPQPANAASESPLTTAVDNTPTEDCPLEDSTIGLITDTSPGSPATAIPELEEPAAGDVAVNEPAPVMDSDVATDVDSGTNCASESLSGAAAEPPAAAAPLPALLAAAWVAAFVIGGAAANGVLHFWGISLGVFLVGAFISLLWLIAFYHGPRWPVATAYLLGGPLYIGFLLAHVLALAQVGENFFYAHPTEFHFLSFPDTSYELGRNWLIFALLTTFATDTGAYLVGRAIGRHPMAPRISPNKTWEGSVGGFLGALISAVLLERILNLGLGHTGWAALPEVGWFAAWNWQPLLIGATVGIGSQCGDLLESGLKRFSQVKDAGSLMPGHGGILDRLDSLLLTIPVVYYLIVTVLRP